MRTTGGTTTMAFCGLLGIALSNGISTAQAAKEELWGETTNGLSMSIAPVATTGARQSNPDFAITIQDVGKEDVVLNLGTMLANGKTLRPNAVKLVLTDDKGQSAELRWADDRVAGRMDDYVVPLRHESTYTLRVSLGEYSSPNTKDGTKLEKGRSTITADFQGTGAIHVNNDLAAVRAMNFWKDKLRSNTVSFVR